MQLFRHLGFLLIGLFIAHFIMQEVNGQAYQTQSTVTSPYGTGQPLQQQSVQQPTSQMPLQQQATTHQQPIRMQPLQTPPKSITHNGVTVYQQAQYQQDPNQPTIGTVADGDRTLPPGYGSPFPTGTQPTGTQPGQGITSQNGSIFNLPSPPQAPQPQPQTASQSPQQPSYSQAQIQYSQPQYTQSLLTASVPGQSITDGTPVPPTTLQPRERVHMGRAAPSTRVPPFVLTPDEQRELDQFLMRWEKISEGIKQYHVDFELWKYDPTIPGVPAGKPYKRPFGSFKYIAPDRFVYYIEGEWINGVQTKRDEKKNPNVMEEKIIIDSKAVYFFDYNAEKVKQANIPPDMIRKGIADSPLPLIFGAKAVDLKKRFSMRIVTGEQYRDTQIWLLARPLMLEDQQEFLQIEIRLDKNNLRAIALKKDDINGKAHDVYVFDNVKVNPWGIGNALPPNWLGFFNPTVPRGWQLEVSDLMQDMNVQMQPNQPGRTGPAPAQMQPGVAGQRNEIPLYTP